MTALRGHHLLCLHFYHGEGYNASFIASLNAVMLKAAAEGAVVCDGPDDVCRRCPHLNGELCAYASEADGQIREMDDVARTLLGVSTGSHVPWAEVRARVPAIFARWHARFCRECDWRGACEKDGWYAALSAALSGH